MASADRLATASDWTMHKFDIPRQETCSQCTAPRQGGNNDRWAHANVRRTRGGSEAIMFSSSLLVFVFTTKTQRHEDS
jgi:hypothetical protein